MSRSMSTKTPAEIAAEGRRLINLARKKEADLRNRTTLAIGAVFQREFLNGWSTPVSELSVELDEIMGRKVNLPTYFYGPSLEEVMEYEANKMDNISSTEGE